MVERRPGLTLFAHLVLILGCALVMLPLWVAFVASTHAPGALVTGLMPLWPGERLVENYDLVLNQGLRSSGAIPVGDMLVNSLIMALAIALGKIAISLIMAYAIVYFRFPGRMLCFWLVFVTLMLPVEVRILPTYKVAAGLGLLNSYTGLALRLDVGFEVAVELGPVPVR